MAGVAVKSSVGEVEELHPHRRGRIRGLAVIIYIGETRHHEIK